MDISASTTAALEEFANESPLGRDRRLKRRRKKEIAEKQRRLKVGRSAPPSDLELACRKALQRGRSRDEQQVIMQLNCWHLCGWSGRGADGLCRARMARVRQRGARFGSSYDVCRSHGGRLNRQVALRAMR